MGELRCGGVAECRSCGVGEFWSEEVAIWVSCSMGEFQCGGFGMWGS